MYLLIVLKDKSIEWPLNSIIILFDEELDSLIWAWNVEKDQIFCFFQINYFSGSKPGLRVKQGYVINIKV
jgi:hypothetical protein